MDKWERNRRTCSQWLLVHDVLVCFAMIWTFIHVSLKLLLNSWKDVYQVFLEELIQARGEALHSEIYKLINCIWNEEELPMGGVFYCNSVQEWL
jgi:hypothetical protein